MKLGFRLRERGANRATEGAGNDCPNRTEFAEAKAMVVAHFSIELGNGIAMGLEACHSFPFGNLRKGERRWRDGTRPVIRNIEITEFQLHVKY